jgi:signal transduction histidine kinase
LAFRQAVVQLMPSTLRKGQIGKSIRYKRKTFHETTIIQIYFFIFGRKQAENI